MSAVTPIAQNRGIKKNIFEQALDKAKAAISGERGEAEKAKVEPATTQIKNNVKDADAYVKLKEASKAPTEKPADFNTVKELWNKAVQVIQEDVVKPVEAITKKITSCATNGMPLTTEDIKLKLGNTSTVTNTDGGDANINEVASAEQIKAVQEEVSRNANIILNNATNDNEPLYPKERAYGDLESALQASANKSKDLKKPSYESNIDLSSDDPRIKQRNEEIKQAWANLEATRKMMAEYRESLTKDKDELADITAQETKVDEQLAEIEKLQENLRQSVGSTITLTNGARLTNDEVEKDGKGIKQLSKEELKDKGIKDPETLLGKDNAFIEYESKDKEGKPITKQHLVNSKLEEGVGRVTNITTDAQDLNGNEVIDQEELPSNNNKPLEKIITSLANNPNQSLYLSSVEFKGNEQIIPPSAEKGVGQKYSDFYGTVGNGHFRTLKLSKEATGMTVESMKSEEFWHRYTVNDNLNSIINTVQQHEFLVGTVKAENNQFTYQMTKDQASRILHLLSHTGNKDEGGRAHHLYANNISLELTRQTDSENVSFTLDANSHNVLSTMILQNPDPFLSPGLNTKYLDETVIPIRVNGSLEYQFILESPEQAIFTSSLFTMAGHPGYGIDIKHAYTKKEPVILNDDSYKEYQKVRQQNQNLINTYSSLSADELTGLMNLKLNQSLEELNGLGQVEKNKIAIAYMLQEKNNNLSLSEPQQIIQFLQEGKDLPSFMYETLKADINLY